MYRLLSARVFTEPFQTPRQCVCVCVNKSFIISVRTYRSIFTEQKTDGRKADLSTADLLIVHSRVVGPDGKRSFHTKVCAKTWKLGEEFGI